MEKNDILLIDKPAGWTSFDVVAKIRGKIKADTRRLHEGRGFCTEMQRKAAVNRTAKRTGEYGERAVQPADAALRSEPRGVSGSAGEQTWRCRCRVKVGHSGTLDPFATGLLVILLGDACKRAGEFLKLDKVYEATIVLGATSTTGDPEGEIAVSGKRIAVSEKEVEEVLRQFTGEITQIPPAYSAIKIGGKRAYQLAREGKTVDVPPRQVTVYSIELLSYKYPELRIRAHVSSGTYIRTLAEDIGRALGTGAYTRELRRLSIGQYSIDHAVGIEQIIT